MKDFIYTANTHIFPAAFHLYRDVLEDRHLPHLIKEAAAAGHEFHMNLLDDGRCDKDQTSFGGVILDPTHMPHEPMKLRDRILAAFWWGPRGRDYILNGIGKADSMLRFGTDPQLYFNAGAHCFRQGDFAWAGGYLHLIYDGQGFPHYAGAVGGSGLSVQLDHMVNEAIGQFLYKQLHDKITEMLKSQQLRGSRGWFGLPNPEYQQIIDLLG
jgi:hypothetical protein